MTRKGREQYLKKALKVDPQMAQAAYNLCIITSKDRINEAVSYCKKAAELRPQEPKYAYTLAFYLNQKGDRRGCKDVTNTHREVSGIQRCRDAPWGNIKNEKRP